ncbi:N-acetyltransferase [Histoplasma ohiense]|uniref:Arylamine N-acetyltransferase 1 n=1 Tax=Ajellomyces capsulatus TaxID=5037 RepID=D8FSV9_AJECA|nr:N-acetyltransferase [Histoplasma ohiense (nom. inval.)]CBL43348.1 TPA: arylamine N-acetyltransferase 1 [Histoplasma capsulatum]
MSSQHPTYTREQLAKYISFTFGCPPDQGMTKLVELEALVQKDPLKALTMLQQRQLAAVPFSNVVLHYSQHRTISLDPDYLFHKLIERGLGGYCLENTGLLAIVIRSLGYQFYTTAGRVSKSYDSPTRAGQFHGWGHMILVVTLNSNKYIVDVGFGPNGPTRPLLLEEDKPVTSFAPAQMRLIKDNISPNVDRSQRLWIYQTKPKPESDWRDAYCFYEVEFLPQDYEILNFWTSQHPTSTFKQKFICTKFLLNETEDDIIGTLALTGVDMKQNINGNLEKIATLNSEADRVSALGKWFNVHLHPMEVRGIKGGVAEIQTSI